MKISPRRLTELIEDADYWRGAPLGADGPVPYKEWQHFVVFGEGWSLLFNLNLDGPAMSRVITIFSGEAWQGEVQTCRQVSLRPGRLDATFGEAGMRWRAGVFEIWQHGPGVRLELSLEPRAIPSLSHHIRLGPAAHLSWCLVPRLSASGWVETGGTRVSFSNRPAYHDHNWGNFAWGGEFSWEWGCAVPEDPDSPWTVIFARMNDRPRHHTSATSIFLLKDGRHLRYYRNAEAEVTTEGSADPRPIGRVPAAAALLLPDEDRDVPLRTRFFGRRGDDQLSGEALTLRRGQILVPSDRDVRKVTRINEADTMIEVSGRCAGETIDFRGPGLLEVVHG